MSTIERLKKKLFLKWKQKNVYIEKIFFFQTKSQSRKPGVAASNTHTIVKLIWHLLSQKHPKGYPYDSKTQL